MKRRRTPSVDRLMIALMAAIAAVAIGTGALLLRTPPTYVCQPLMNVLVCQPSEGK